MEDQYLRQTELELARACAGEDKKACKELYVRFSGALWPVCLRYARNKMIAEDIFQEGFIRIYRKIKTFKGSGSLEGWMRRIMVTTALNYIDKHKRHITEPEAGSASEPHRSAGTIEKISADELIELVQRLPDAYRLVFNMFAIEGYSHKEISVLLDISENTSKSRMLRARMLLQQMIGKKEDKEVRYARTKV